MNWKEKRGNKRRRRGPTAGKKERRESTSMGRDRFVSFAEFKRGGM